MSSLINNYNNFKYSKKECDLFSDEELILEIRDNNEQAENCLYKRYSFIIKKIVSSFFIIGGSSDDLFQEAMIGLFKAIKGYDEKNGCRFRSYAEICIRRQIISVIRKTKICELHNSFVCSYDCNNEDEGIAIIENYADLESLNPENILICKEENNDYYSNVFNSLSEFEKEALLEYCKGNTYQEISITLNRNIKSVDNALLRVKKKSFEYKNKLIKS